MFGVQKLSLLPRIEAAVAKIVSCRCLRDGRQVHNLEPALVQEVADEIVLMHTLHHDHDPGGALVVWPGHEG